jgi:hypothetical protein
MQLPEIAAKWQRNAVAGVQKNLAAGLQRAPGRYCAGLAKIGVPQGACETGAGAAYRQGIATINPAEVASRIQGTSPNVWAERFVEGITR